VWWAATKGLMVGTQWHPVKPEQHLPQWPRRRHTAALQWSALHLLAVAQDGACACGWGMDAQSLLPHPTAWWLLILLDVVDIVDCC